MYFLKHKRRGYLGNVKIHSHYNWRTRQTIPDTASLVFNRTFDKVKGGCVFETEKALHARVAELMKDELLDTDAKQILTDCEIVEHDERPLHKRYLKSYHKFDMKGMIVAKDDNNCCGVCGITISTNEHYLKFGDGYRNELKMCLHCIGNINDTCKDIVDSDREKYESAWLIEVMSRNL